jgi:hypothetical protein
MSCDILPFQTCDQIPHSENFFPGQTNKSHKVIASPHVLKKNFKAFLKNFTDNARRYHLSYLECFIFYEHFLLCDDE